MSTPDEAAQRSAMVDLVAATRSLMLASATSDLPAADLAVATEAIHDLSVHLSSRSRPGVFRIEFDKPGAARAQGPDAVWHTYQLNPFGIPLEVRFDQDTAHGTFVPDGLHEGPPDSLHGGWSAHLMDCMLGGLVQATGARSVTATLDLRYRNKVPLGARVDLYAEITHRSGRKIHAVGRIEVDGLVCVEATGLFVRVDGIVAGAGTAEAGAVDASATLGGTVADEGSLEEAR